MNVFKDFFCCTHGPSVIAFVSTQSELRLARPRTRCEIRAPTDSAAVRRQGSVKPAARPGDNASGLSLCCSPVKTRVDTAQENRHAENPFAEADDNRHHIDTRGSNQVPAGTGKEFPRRGGGTMVPPKGKYTFNPEKRLHVGNNKGKRKGESLTVKTGQNRQSKKSLTTVRASSPIPYIPVGTAANRQRDSVAPSQNSKFRYVPNYFRPDVLKQFKLDADLVTALAKATECRQKSHEARNRLSEATDTGSTSALTSRTGRGEANLPGGVNV